MNRLVIMALILSLASCGLIQMPFRVAGGVTKGAANAVRKPVDAHKRRKEKKKQEKAKEEAKKKKAEANQQQSDHLPPELLPPANDGYPDLESIDPDLPPLPSEYSSDPIGNE